MKSFREQFPFIGFILTVLTILLGAIASYVMTEYPTAARILIGLTVCCIALLIGLFLYYTAKQVTNIFKKLQNSEQTLTDLNSKLQDLMKAKNGDETNPLSSRRYETCPALEKTYYSDVDDVDSELRKLLRSSDPRIKELHIICYGRNGFGKNVDFIIKRSQELDIKLRIVVFNPKIVPEICLDTDYDLILENIKKWKTVSPNVEVYVSNIPPMIRAAVAYSYKDNRTSSKALHPVWGTVQAYRFAYKNAEKKFTIENPECSLISVVNEKNTVSDAFQMVIKYFENEYTRLVKYSKIAVLNSEHDVVLNEQTS